MCFRENKGVMLHIFARYQLCIKLQKLNVMYQATKIKREQ